MKVVKCVNNSNTILKLNECYIVEYIYHSKLVNRTLYKIKDGLYMDHSFKDVTRIFKLKKIL